MLYRLTRLLLRGALSQFFAGIRVTGAARLEHGPVLLVGNHPNLALDSLVIGAVFERELWYLAKSTLFRNPIFARLLRALHVIPVYRRQDNPDDMSQNIETFRRAAERLAAGAAVVVFPEGVSRGERKLAPIRTGAARIGFAAEEAAGFTLGVRIQPVGLTYSELGLFRSSVTVRVGVPIEVGAGRGEFEADALAAVRKLTAAIEEGLRQVTVELADSHQQILVEKIARLYRSRGSTLDDLERLTLIGRNVEAVSAAQPGIRGGLERRIDEYLALASLFMLEEGGLLDRPREPLRTALVLPLVVLGFLLHYLPYRAVGRMVAGASPVALASQKLGFGLLLFSLWYALLVGSAGLLWGGAVALLTLGILLVSGFAVNNYLHHARLLLLAALWPGKRNPIQVLAMVRDELIGDLERLRVV